MKIFSTEHTKYAVMMDLVLHRAHCFLCHVVFSGKMTSLPGSQNLNQRSGWEGELGGHATQPVKNVYRRIIRAVVKISCFLDTPLRICYWRKLVFVCEKCVLHVNFNKSEGIRM